MLPHLTHYGSYAFTFVKGQEAELRPEVDEVAVSEDGVRLAEFLIHERHNQRQVMLACVASVLNLTLIELLFISHLKYTNIVMRLGLVRTRSVFVREFEHQKG